MPGRTTRSSSSRVAELHPPDAATRVPTGRGLRRIAQCRLHHERTRAATSNRAHVSNQTFGAPGKIRTPDLLIRGPRRGVRTCAPRTPGPAAHLVDLHDSPELGRPYPSCDRAHRGSAAGSSLLTEALASGAREGCSDTSGRHSRMLLGHHHCRAIDMIARLIGRRAR